MTDNQLFSENVFQPVSICKEYITFDALYKNVFVNDVEEIDESEVVDKVLKGAVVVFLSNTEKILSVDLLKFNMRTPSEPPTSPVIMGPREGFTEDIKTNISLIRRRFYSEKLVFEQCVVGSVSKTQVALAYIDGIADDKIVSKIKKRLKEIKIDGIVDSYYLLTLLSDRPNSLFKQIGCAEKPDIVAAKMLEGRVAVIVDNSPIVLTIPFVFLEDLQSSNDYYTNNIYSTLLRF
ncbi:MAG: spore germination protein, partial [Clostridia bacterium]|nr:spore germination protein [Clostridia bacterium]